MALSITHTAVVVTADDGTSEVGSNEWNAAHSISGLGAGVETFLGTPSSANLASAITDETGTGALVFANTPTLVTPALGAATATSITASSAVNAVRHVVTSATTASAVTILGSTGATAAYTVTLPSSQGNASTLLQNDGSGVLSWATASGGATIHRFYPASNEPPATNYATLSTRNSHPILQFDDTVAESAIFTSVLSTGYAAGGLACKVAYSMTSSSTGTVGWTLEFERIGNSQLDIDADSFGTAITVTAVTIPGTNGFVGVSTVTATSTAVLSGIAAGEQFRIRLKRDVANDTAVGDAEFHWLSALES